MNHFNPNQPRDAHGKWVKGAGTALKALEVVVKGHGGDGGSPVSKGDARLAQKAYERHIEQGRKFPGQTTSYEDTLKNMEAVSKGIREDAVKWNKKDPKIAQQLRKQARAMEKVMAAHKGSVPTKTPTEKKQSSTSSAAQPQVGTWTKKGTGFYSLVGSRYAVVSSHAQSKSEDADKADNFTTKKEWALVKFKDGEEHTSQGGENIDWFDSMELAKAAAPKPAVAKTEKRDAETLRAYAQDRIEKHGDKRSMAAIVAAEVFKDIGLSSNDISVKTGELKNNDRYAKISWMGTKATKAVRDNKDYLKSIGMKPYPEDKPSIISNFFIKDMPNEPAKKDHVPEGQADLPPAPINVQVKGGDIVSVGDTVVAKGSPVKVIDLDARKTESGNVRDVVVTPIGKFWADTVTKEGGLTTPEPEVVGEWQREDIPDGTHVWLGPWTQVTLKKPIRHMVKKSGSKIGGKDEYTPSGVDKMSAGKQVWIRPQVYTNSKGKVSTGWSIGNKPEEQSWNESLPHDEAQKGYFSTLPSATPPVPEGTNESTETKGEPPYTLKGVAGKFTVYKDGEAVQSFDDRGKARRWARTQNRKAGFGAAKKGGKKGGGGPKKAITKGDWVVNKDGRRGEVVGVNEAKEPPGMSNPEDLVNVEELLGNADNPYGTSSAIYNSSWQSGFLAGARGENAPPPAGVGSYNYAGVAGHKAGKKARAAEIKKIKTEQAERKREAKGGFEVRYNTGAVVRELPRNVKLTEPPVSIYRHQGDVPGQAQGLFEALKAGVEADETDWSRLDPSKRPDLPEGHVVGHAQEILFDLARGSERPKAARVVTNEELRSELQEEGFIEKANEQAKKKTPYTFKINSTLAKKFEGSYGGLTIKTGRGKYSAGTVTYTGDFKPGDREALAMLHTLGRPHSGGSIQIKTQDVGDNKWYYSHNLTAESSDGYNPLDILRKKELRDAAYRSQILDALEFDRNQEIMKNAKKIIDKEITARRKKEGATSIAYNLPHWEDIKMVEQNWDDVKDHMQTAARGSFVPVFHTSGQVEDGVVYHRRGAGGTRGTEIKEGRVFLLEHLGFYRVTKVNGDRVETERIDAQGKKLNMAGPDAGKFAIPQLLDGATHYWDDMPTGGGQLVTTTGPTVAGYVPAKMVEKPVPVLEGVTASRSNIEADASIIAAMKKAGATITENSKNIDPGYRGRGKIYAGQMHLIDLGGGTKFTDAQASEAFRREHERFASEQPLSGATRLLANNVTMHAGGAHTLAETHAIIEGSAITAKQSIPGSNPGIDAYKVGGLQYNRAADTVDKAAEQLKKLATESFNRRTLGKRIEYVPHEQPKLGAPTSQRGRITIHGLTPEEATAKLQELGIVGEVETHVPFNVVMRSNRREGRVLPLHRDYLTGDAPPPELLHLITHGFTSSNTDFIVESVLRGGGLHSIAERYRRGIAVRSASPAGDIRSGIDHVIFGAHDSGSTCGSSSPVRIAYKPEALLRRNVLMAPRDYGGMDTRYEMYKGYLNGLQRRSGEPTTSLYQPISPAVRQKHIAARKRPGSAEFNIPDSVPVEDMAVIGVNSQQMADKVNKILEEELAAGRIASRPEVVIGRSAFDARVNT